MDEGWSEKGNGDSDRPRAIPVHVCGRIGTMVMEFCKACGHAMSLHDGKGGPCVGCMLREMRERA